MTGANRSCTISGGPPSPPLPRNRPRFQSICCSLHSPFSALRCQPEVVCSTSPMDFVQGIDCLMGPLTAYQWTTDRESVADNAANAAETDRTLSVRLFVYHDDQSSPGQSKNHFLAHLQKFPGPEGGKAVPVRLDFRYVVIRRHFSPRPNSSSRTWHHLTGALSV